MGPGTSANGHPALSGTWGTGVLLPAQSCGPAASPENSCVRGLLEGWPVSLRGSQALLTYDACVQLNQPPDNLTRRI